MSPAADRFLAAHPGMQPSGPRRWRGWCPACQASLLGAYETVNGVLLVRCFTQGCSAAKIAASLALQAGEISGQPQLPMAARLRSACRAVLATLKGRAESFLRQVAGRQP